MEVVGDGGWEASAGDSCDAGRDGLAGTTVGGVACGSGSVLGGDRGGGLKRGRCRCGGGVAGGGGAVVPTGWRDGAAVVGPDLIKRVKRAAFGFRRFAHCRIRALLYAGKPNWALLASVTPR